MSRVEIEAGGRRIVVDDGAQPSAAAVTALEVWESTVSAELREIDVLIVNALRFAAGDEAASFQTRSHAATAAHRWDKLTDRLFGRGNG